MREDPVKYSLKRSTLRLEGGGGQEAVWVERAAEKSRISLYR